MSNETGASEQSARPLTEGRGMLIVVSSPSGGGKGTLIERVLQRLPDLAYSVSWTTRAPRAGEQDGRDYHFVSVAEFARMREQDEFLEWAEVHGNLYGTSRRTVARETGAGRDVILEIDTQGAATVRAKMPEAVSVFILPPTFEVLRARLTARASENADSMALRLRNAPAEVARYREFDYVVLNDEADRAAAQLAAIVYAERARRERQERVAQAALATFLAAPQASR